MGHAAWASSPDTPLASSLEKAREFSSAPYTDRVTPPRYLRPGDVCALEVEKLGILENPVAAA